MLLLINNLFGDLLSNLNGAANGMPLNDYTDLFEAYGY